jgi:integrase
MGLGNASVSLAEARDKADEARKLLTVGRNPIAAKREAEEAKAGLPTFGQTAEAFIEAKAPGWRNPKHQAQWRQTLKCHAATLWIMPVGDVDTKAVLGVLQPLWQKVPETASRLRGRIEAVLDAARAKGHIPPNEANPARWRGHLDKLLAKRQSLSRGHHTALPYPEVPAFLASLRERQATAALALEFCILTAVRSGEVLGARWCEIDLETMLWTIPAARMKAGRAHRVPLSTRALTILKKLAEAKSGDFAFPGQKSGKPLSSTAMEMLLRRMNADATVHGFRSSFRDWAGNETNFSRELAEAALSHVIGDKAEQAYRRSDALDKRRALMQAWANYCEPEAGSNVVRLAPARS